jgi:hypothetical protein
MDEPRITIYVLYNKGNGEGDNVERLIASLPEGLCTVVYQGRRENGIDKPTTPWWCYMYGNEWMEPTLAKALDPYTKYFTHDCYVFFKRVKVGGKDKFFIEPRLFRSATILPMDNLQLQDLLVTRGLDGFILEDDREE